MGTDWTRYESHQNRELIVEIRVFGLNKFQGRGGAVAFFDIEIDGAFVIRGNMLFESSRNEGEYYWKGKSTPRVKNGEHLVDEETGRPIYDDMIRPTFEEGGKFTEAANEFFNTVRDQAVAQLTRADAGRGQPTKTATKTSATAKAPTRKRPVGASSRTTDAEPLDESDVPF